MKRYLSVVFNVFVKVTAFVVVFIAIYFEIFYKTKGTVDVDIFFKICLLSLICSAGCIILPEVRSEREPGKKEKIIFDVLYYIYINASVMIYGYVEKWFLIERPWMVICMEIGITAIFVGIYFVNYLSSKMTAEKLNETIKRNKKEQS